MKHLCDSDRIQTCNLLIRSQMLYSVKLRSLFNCDCKVNTFIWNNNTLKQFFIKKLISTYQFNVLSKGISIQYATKFLKRNHCIILLRVILYQSIS